MTRGVPDVVVVGRAVRPHGLLGEVVVEVESDVDERFAPGSTMRLGAHGRRVEVVAARPFGDRLLVRFAGLDDRTAVEGLRGIELTVGEDEVPEAPAGSYYHFELLGCSCRDRLAGDLGRVRAIHEDGGGLLLEVEDGERRILVPFVEAFIVAVDVEAGRIGLDLPPGLVDVCAST
jgi:16S rRNA processing protein RimM